MPETRDQRIARVLRHMEHLSEIMHECDTAAEERRLRREYKALWESIQPDLKARDERRPMQIVREDGQ